jgi:hypothetical protein
MYFEDYFDMYFKDHFHILVIYCMDLWKINKMNEWGLWFSGQLPENFMHTYKFINYKLNYFRLIITFMV